METQTKQYKNNQEISLLIECSQILNGFSKAFRDLWAEKNQDERIEFMQSLLKEHREEMQIKLIQSHMYKDLSVLKNIQIKDGGLSQEAIRHLRALIQCWKDNGLVENEDEFKAIQEDVETFIRLEAID